MTPSLADLMLSDPSELTVGQCYATLWFVDDELQRPEIHTWIYIGYDIEGRGDAKWYFQDIESFSTKGSARLGRAPKATLFVVDRGEVTHMFDLIRLGEALMRIGRGRCD